jgi:phage terminase large subunit
MQKQHVQLPKACKVLFEPSRYKVLYSGRGAAKSWSIAAALLIIGAQRPLRVLCARETMQSMKDSVHRLLSDTIDRLGLRGVYQVQQATILGPNGTEFVFAGLKHNVTNIKSVEGMDVVWVEEAQSVSKDSWDTLIPSIRKPNSEIWVSFNPDLDTDDTYKRFVLKPQPGAKVVKLSWRDNPWFPEVLRVEMEHLKATAPLDYAHIWEGETRSTVDGAIYGQELTDAQSEGRITTVSVDRTKPVHTFWDLGYGDKTAIWFGQAMYGGTYHLVDYLEGEGLTIEKYLIQLQNKPYMYGVDWLPHDGVDAILHKRLSGGDRTRSIEQIIRAAGRSVRITPKLNKLTGINAARTILPNCRFDAEKCADGLQALRHYQWGPINEHGMTRREPLHNWASHAADAFRGFATSIRTPHIAREEESVFSAHHGGSDSWMA